MNRFLSLISCLLIVMPCLIAGQSKQKSVSFIKNNVDFKISSNDILSDYQADSIVYEEAEWTDNASLNTQITYDGTGKALPRINLKEDGSSIVTWLKNENGNYNLYMQTFNSQGNALLNSGGVVISSHNQRSWFSRYDTEFDAEGNLLVALADIRNYKKGSNKTFNDVTVYKMSPQGEFLWGKDGVTITDSRKENVEFFSAYIYQDNVGNFFVRASVVDYTKDSSEYCERIYRLNNKGETEKICNLTGEFLDCKVISKDRIAVVYNKDEKLYLKILSNEFELITQNPILVSDNPEFSQGMRPAIRGRLHEDKSGGIYIIWEGVDERFQTIKWQYIDFSYRQLCSKGGEYISSKRDRNHSSAFSVYLESKDKVYVIWEEMKNNEKGIYAQSLNSDGSKDFVDTGKEVFGFSPLLKGCNGLINRNNQFVILFSARDSDPSPFNHDFQARASFLNENLEPDVYITNPIVNYCSELNSRGRCNFSYNSNMIAMVWKENRKDDGKGFQLNNELYMQNLYFNGTIGKVRSNDIPKPVNVHFPKSSSVDCSIETEFSWSEALFVEGYRFYLGKSIEELIETDLGNRKSTIIKLEDETKYYWRVVPYNSYGDAKDCPIWSFITKKDNTTGGIDMNKADSLCIFPNPACDLVYVKSEKVIKRVDIVSVNGKVLKTIFADDFKNEIDISLLSEGIYFVRVWYSNSKFVSRLLKKDR